MMRKPSRLESGVKRTIREERTGEEKSGEERKIALIARQVLVLC